MKITESRLRSMISEVIDEMNHMAPQEGAHMQGVDHDMRSFMDKAKACCNMPAAKLFDMCAKICAKNTDLDQARHCAELCACARRGDEQGCCRCLSEICKCGHCAEVCAQYCGC